MYKLIILIEPPYDQEAFDESWPRFLREVEKMPGLVREATVRMVDTIYGESQFHLIHELFFQTREELQTAMASPKGQTSGRVLQQITGGKMSLIIAEHREDNIENIQNYHEKNLNSG
jgi:uncharacterized protein (TIGR02118 family)